MLAWEIWRRNYKYACLSLGAIPGYLLFYWAIRSHVHNGQPLAKLSLLCVVFSLFWAVATFNYTEVNSAKGWTGFPHRLFVLPVPTVVLVMLPMLLGMVTVGLVCVAWVKHVVALCGAVLPPRLAWWLAGLLAVNLACFQAVVWSLAGFRLTRMVVLALGSCVLLVLEGFTWASLFAPGNRAQMKDYPFGEGGWVLLYVGLALIAFVGAWYSVGRQRRGGGRGHGWLKAWAGGLAARIVDCLPSRKSPFASPLAAQCWFEWRRGGVLLPVCVGSVLVLVLGPISWLNAGQMNAGGVVFTLSVMLLTPLVLAVIIGKGFARPDFWSKDSSVPPFLAVRPLSSGDFVVAKMKVAAFSTLITWLLMLAAIPLWFALWVDTSILNEFSHWGTSEKALVLATTFGTDYAASTWYAILVGLSLASAMVLTWRGMVGSLWVGLSGSGRRLAGSAILHGVCLIMLLTAFMREDEFSARQLALALGWVLALAVVAKLWVALYAWGKVARRHLAPNTVMKYLAIWTSGTICLATLACLACPRILWLKYILVLAALLAFPLARLGLAPLSLAHNRHR